MENRSIAASVLALLLLFAAGYAIWNGVLNKGIIAITGTTPLSVQIDTEPAFICQTSPCEFRVKVGPHSVTLRQDGYTDYAKLVNVSRGSRIEIVAELEKIIQVKALTEKWTIPKIENPFVLQTNSNTGIQAIVKKSVTSSEVVAYFSRPFEAPNIYTNPSQSVIWIVNHGKSSSSSSSIYQVDVQKKSRTLLYETSKKILGIVASPSGKSIAVLLADSVDLVTQQEGSALAVTLSLKVALSKESALVWKNDRVFFYLDSLSGADVEPSTVLKRGYLNNLQQQDSIRTWPLSQEKVSQLFNDAPGNRLIVIGENASYVVEE